MATELILGTAGHIDHGKTALVQALTGVDTDRLREEKERGISIEIGFAHLDLDDVRLGIVDLPGHERFIRNMLAGACGIDVAMLVVAADDSVMPQTREHLAILTLLEIPRGIVVVTKTDLVEPSWLDLVEDDIRELVAGTFLEHAPIVRTSARSGAGMDELRAALGTACAEAADPEAERLFRLAVDRAFVVQGLGTVVTGTVWSGEATAEDELEWMPPGRAIRVRGMQSHGRDVASVHRGQRAAMNLSGVHHTEIGRGDTLARPGYLRSSRRISATIDVLADSPWPVRHRARVRLHVGTQEVIARVHLLRGAAVGPGESGLAQLVCAEPIAVTNRQPFVIRSESPLRTLGGGKVLQPAARRIARRDADRIDRVGGLAAPDAEVRAETAAYFYGTDDWSARDLCRDADIDESTARKILERFESDGVVACVPAGGRRTLRIHRDQLATLGDRIVDRLEKLHAASPLETAIPVARLGARLASLAGDALTGLLQRLRDDGRIVGDGVAVALPRFQPVLSENQTRLHETVLEAFRTAGFEPPELKEIAAAEGVTPEALRPIIDLCVSQRHLAHVGGSLYLHREWEEELRRRVAEHLGDGAGKTVSEIKEMLGTSRKYAVPFCEYLDRAGVTRRKENLRVLAGP